MKREFDDYIPITTPSLFAQAYKRIPSHITERHSSKRLVVSEEILPITIRNNFEIIEFNMPDSSKSISEMLQKLVDTDIVTFDDTETEECE